MVKKNMSFFQKNYVSKDTLMHVLSHANKQE